MPKRREFMNSNQLNEIASAVFDVLENVGIKIENETILETVAKQGVIVDKQSQVVKFPSKLLEDFLAKRKKEVLQEQAALSEVTQEKKCIASMGNVVNFYHDWDANEIRPATKKEFIEMVKLGEALEDVQGVTSPLIMSEVDPKIEPLESIATLIRYTSNPGGVDEISPKQVDYLAEMGTIFDGNPARFVSPCIYFTAPLILGDRSAESMLRKLKFKSPIRIGTMATSGSNAPITVAGTVVVGAAEILAGWMCVKACDPDAKLQASICTGSTNMSSVDASYSSPTAVLEQVAILDLFRHLCGGGVQIGGVSIIEAKVPGIQATFERLYKAMLVSYYMGSIHYTVGSIGTLASINTFSPVQAMIDLEINRALDMFLRGIDTSPASLAVDTIKEIGIGGSYMGCNHTLDNFQKACWLPSLFCAGTSQDQSDFYMLDKANEQWKEALKKYTEPVVDKNVIKEIDKVVENARKKILV